MRKRDSLSGTRPETDVSAEPTGTSSEERRQRNREFMRQWRRDPLHQGRERVKRRERYYSREKQRAFAKSIRSSALENRRGLCGFCWRPAVKDVIRLRVCESSPDGYVEVLTPYCGEC